LAGVSFLISSGGRRVRLILGLESLSIFLLLFFLSFSRGGFLLLLSLLVSGRVFLLLALALSLQGRGKDLVYS